MNLLRALSFFWRPALAACAAGVLLAGCGGSDPAGQAAAPRLLSGGASQSASLGAPGATAAEYSNAVQQLYVSYFGRPADPAGLANFQAALLGAAAPTDIQGLDAAYQSNPTVRQLVDNFSASDESARLYTGDTTAFIQAIYRNVLNRSELDSGAQFWISAIDQGGLKRANAALSIMAGALANTSPQGQLDAAVIIRKIAIATRFTAAVPAGSYRGDTAAALARTMLGTVSAGTDAQSFDLGATLAAIEADALAPFVGNYAGSYSGVDAGTFSFTIAADGKVSGSGHSTMFGYDLGISGSLAGGGGGLTLAAQGTAGVAAFTGSIDASGKLTGTWSIPGEGGGTFGGQRL